MATTEDRLKPLREKINAATTARARAEVEHETAIKERDNALAALAEFGVSSPQEAAAKLAELEAALETELAAVEAALEEAK